VGSPVLHRPSADANAAGRVPDIGVPKPHLRMGPGPPGPPQVHRHGRRSAQLVSGIFLLAHGLVDGPQAPGRVRKGWRGRHERPGSRPGRHVSEKVSPTIYVFYSIIIY